MEQKLDTESQKRRSSIPEIEICWEVCVLLIESGEFYHFHWKRRTCLTHYWHNAPFFFMFESKKVLGSAASSLRLQFDFCRTKSASLVRFLQKQDYVFISAAEEPRHHQFVLCRTKATALFHCLQNQDSIFISSSAEPIPPVQFFLLQNQDYVFSSFYSFYVHQSRESFLRNVNSSVIPNALRTLWSAKFYHHVHKSLPRVCILSQMNSVHISQSAAVLFPVWGWVCSFPSAQQAYRPLSQGNLRGRPLKGPR